MLQPSFEVSGMDLKVWGWTKRIGKKKIRRERTLAVVTVDANKITERKWKNAIAAIKEIASTDS